VEGKEGLTFHGRGRKRGGKRDIGKDGWEREKHQSGEKKKRGGEGRKLGLVRARSLQGD